GAVTVAVCAAIEAEIAQLEDADRADFLAELKCSGYIVGRFSAKYRPRPCLRNHWNKTMSVNALALYGNKKVSPSNLTTIVMYGGKDLFRVGGYSIMNMKQTAIALPYVLKGEHCRMSLYCFLC
ncbi:MAG TPA: hypothetical protein VIY29_10745, partial [Ktedonobacteraceae bacterium]